MADLPSLTFEISYERLLRDPRFLTLMRTLVEEYGGKWYKLPEPITEFLQRPEAP